MNKFKVGDRVISESDPENIGTIIGYTFERSPIIVSVEHDSPMGGHTCNGRCKEGYGWNYKESELDLKVVETPKKIVNKMVSGMEGKMKGMGFYTINEVEPTKQNTFTISVDLPQGTQSINLERTVSIDGVPYLANIKLERM